jgi:hypothetical protein
VRLGSPLHKSARQSLADIWANQTVTTIAIPCLIAIT